MKSFRRAFAAALASFLVGLAVGIAHPAIALLELVRENVRFTFESIYLHNLKVQIIIYFLSIIYIGLIVVSVNGYVLGSAIVYALAAGLTPLEVAAAILPHGIFEIPALLAASATGLVTMDRLRRKKLGGVVLIVAALLAQAALLAVAAFVEVYVTPLILKLLGVRVEPVG